MFMERSNNLLDIVFIQSFNRFIGDANLLDIIWIQSFNRFIGDANLCLKELGILCKDVVFPKADMMKKNE